MASKQGGYRLYDGQSWTNDRLELEYNTLRSIDCTFWLRSAVALLRSDSSGGVKFKSPETGEIYLNDPTPAHRLSARLFRYLSSEQLFYLLFSGQGDWLYVQAATKIRPDKLTRYYKHLAKELVPTDLSSLNKRKVDFKTWITVKMGDWEARKICPTLYNFIVNEADFLSVRNFINAIKHGRAQTNPTVQGIFPEIEKGIFIQEWRDECILHAEDFDLKEEAGNLYVSGMIMSAIIETRCAYLKMRLNGKASCNVNFSLPDNILSTRRVTRYMNRPAHGQQRSL